MAESEEDMSDFEYIIVGDTEKYKECLVYICGVSEGRAKEVLDRIKSNPTENDKAITNSHVNLRIKEVEAKSCWWRHDCD